MHERWSITNPNRVTGSMLGEPARSIKSDSDSFDSESESETCARRSGPGRPLTALFGPACDPGALALAEPGPEAARQPREVGPSIVDRAKLAAQGRSPQGDGAQAPLPPLRVDRERREQRVAAVEQRSLDRLQARGLQRRRGLNADPGEGVLRHRSRSGARLPRDVGLLGEPVGIDAAQ